MKQLLLSLTLAALSSAPLRAQQHLALYEEFTGENCGPCAVYNPDLWTLLGANSTKVVALSYQSPIPFAGPIYNAYRTVTDARSQYYNVPFAPYGRLDGTGLGTGTAVPSGPGHVANLLQSDIDAAAATAAPFTIGAAHQWRPAGDSLTATITITAAGAYAPSGANLKLRVALIERLHYATAPGTNGETDFHNVVREMYPDAGGTQLPNAWTAGQSQTFTLTGRVPSYVNKAPNGETRIVAWVQNDTDQTVAQAAVSAYIPLPMDIASTGLLLPGPFVCDSASTTLYPVVSLTNAASTPLTSASIYYRLDTGAWLTYAWTGALPAQTTTLVGLPALVVAPGTHVVTDSVALPNGAPDVNGGNNMSRATVVLYNTARAALPTTASFENAGALPPNWLLYDANANGQNWTLANVGHNNSSYALRHSNADFFAGEVNYAIIAAANLPNGGKVLDFYVAYAQLFAISDLLEVVYSTNCGASWVSLWGQGGAALATAPSMTFAMGAFVPTQSQWALQTVDLRNVPRNAMLAFRATSGYGNNFYLDDVTIRATPLAVTDAVSPASIALAPNPTNLEAELSFDLRQAGTVRVDLVDALGRVAAMPTNGNLRAGLQHIRLNTAGLATGLYNVVIHTADGSLTRHLSVVH
ncbi:choice-of-anchor J domain-containing protein [Hymenobacter negativus]|uniref:Choice-of-anchor J domain-containing protein n=1 Tax=Hymenobacter negativus TaxID=2795026 RepID=A0ABS3QMH7_9BACT|nr:choice-of-anchor J domain-containing protein [Hymenobacter negativus]MBO2012464.1 choice-of-anchor J domain-containing protein [Hymenobacter negativus]